MSEMNEYKVQRKREYHRKWRAEHPESVKAAQVRYWTKKAAELRSQEPAAGADQGNLEQN